MKKNIIIYTDLDGTLLDYKTYSFDEAKVALQLIKEKAIPLIIVSSKTRAEIEHYREKMSNKDPFVSENGGGIFIPIGYSKLTELPETAKQQDNYYVIKLGTEYSKLREVLNDIKKEGFKIVGFGDMSIQEICRLTSLSPYEASLCKQREFDEPFIFSGTEKDLKTVIKRIKDLGFNYTFGAYHHITGKNDKGKAIQILNNLFKESLGDILTIGLGDSLNDLDMLKKVDIPVAIRKPDGGFDDTIIKIKNVIKTDAIGPKGWQQAIKMILNMV